MVRLKIKNTLVLLFYLFAFLTTVFRIIQTVSILSTVNAKIMEMELPDQDELGTESISDSLSVVFTTAMGLVIVATMYKIAVSLQMLMEELTPWEHKVRKVRFYIASAIGGLLVCGEASMVYTQILIKGSTEVLINVIIYSSLCVLFALTMAFLLKKLNKMDRPGLSQERKKIVN